MITKLSSQGVTGLGAKISLGKPFSENVSVLLALLMSLILPYQHNGEVGKGKYILLNEGA